MAPFAESWFFAAAGQLELRREDRVLALLVRAGEVRHLAAQVGAAGRVLAVQPDRGQAEAIAALGLPQVEALALPLRGEEHFGAFDALVCAPAGMPGWGLGGCADLARSNLRPGGRFVFDLPGAVMLAPVVAAFAELGWDPSPLQRWSGPGASQLVDALRGAGLRRAQEVFANQWLRLESPFDLADWVGGELGLAAPSCTQLGQVLVHRLANVAAAEVLVQRVRVVGQR
ncbi:MAG: hypothetical protein JNK49_17950 [Planctomycetes bacterium]|nr:hypothetical protein [Planctomycetota bacterium]